METIKNPQELQEVPQLPEGSPIDLSPYFLSAAQHYEEPHYLLEFNSVPFSPLGGIQAITGQKKNGKTWLMTIFMAAILQPDSERLKAYMPGLTLNPDTSAWLRHAKGGTEGEVTSVLYIDTEMEQLNTAKVMRRVHWLCGWDMDEDSPRFKVMWLRGVVDNKDKYTKAMEAINQLKPTAVFIDGIRDIMQDFNDNAESALLVNTLMAKATDNCCCIWSVLHYNPKPSNDDDISGKMRGHLGTELGNKVTDTFSCTKKKDNKGVTFTVRQQDARGKDVDDFTFEITEDAGILGVPRMITPSEERKQTVKKLREMFINGQDEIEWPATGTDIKAMLKAQGHSGKGTSLQESIGIARAERFIVEQDAAEMVKGQRCPKFYLNTMTIPSKTAYRPNDPLETGDIGDAELE